MVHPWLTQVDDHVVCRICVVLRVCGGRRNVTDVLPYVRTESCCHRRVALHTAIVKA